MQTKLNKLILASLVIMLTACQGGTSSSTTPSNQELTLNDYVSMLDYVAPTDSVNTTVQAGNTYQQSFTADEPVTLTSINVSFYDDAHCTGNMLSSNTMNANNPQSPATMPAGTYNSTNTSNIALANRFQNVNGESGSSAEFDQVKSLKFVYNYNQAPGISSICLSNNNIEPNQEKISNVDSNTPCATGSSCGFSQAYNIDLEFETAGNGVRGWPSYIAQGGISMNYAIESHAIAEYNQRPVDAIFAYNNADGLTTLNAPIITQSLIDNARAISANNGTYTRPVIVQYTLNQNQGINAAPLAESPMAMNFTKLIYNVQAMERTYGGGSSPNPGNFILNPNTLGTIQTNNGTDQGQPFSGSFPVNAALHTAICATTNNFTWNVTINVGYMTFPYESTDNAVNVYFSMQRAAPASVTPEQAKAAWDPYFQNTIYPQCNSSSTITSGITIPTFTDDFKGWIQATNWIFKQFGSHITFGWQENMLPTATPEWVHNYSLTAQNIKTQYADPVSTWLKNENVFNGTYRPDFIVFDKYAYDDYQLAPSNAFNKGWLWNQADFSNYLTYVKDVTESIGLDQASKPYYAMLWQIPGGHLQYTTETKMLDIHASTEPVIVFGDNVLKNNFSNVKGTLNGQTGHNYFTLPVAYVASGFQFNSPLAFLLNHQSSTVWNTSHMQNLADAHVFSVLWGAPTATSVGTMPWDDPWLSNKIKTYYQNPTDVKSYQ